MITKINEFKKNISTENNINEGIFSTIKNIFNKDKYVLRIKKIDNYDYLQASNNYGRTFKHVTSYNKLKRNDEYNITPDQYIDQHKLNTLEGIKLFFDKIENDKKIAKDRKKTIQIPIKENNNVEVQNDLVTISLDENGNNLSADFSNGFTIEFKNINKQNANKGFIILCYVFNGWRIIQKIWTRYTSFNRTINPFAKAIEGYLENDEIEGAVYAMVKALKYEVQKTKDQGTNFDEKTQKNLDALDYIDSKIPSEMTFENNDNRSDEDDQSKINEDIMHSNDNIPEVGETVESVDLNDMKDQVTITFSGGKKVMIVGDFNETSVNEDASFNPNDIKTQSHTYNELLRNGLLDITTDQINKNGNIKFKNSKNGDNYTISKNTGKLLKTKTGSSFNNVMFNLDHPIINKKDIEEIFTYLLSKLINKINKNSNADYVAIIDFSLPNYHIVLNGQDRLLNTVNFKKGDEIKTSYQSGSLGDIWKVTNLNTNETAQLWSYTYGLPKEIKYNVKKLN